MELELSHLKRMIGAASFQFDDSLVKKGYDPKKLRTQFYKYISDSFKFTSLEESKFDTQTDEFQILIKNLAQETIIVKEKSCIILQFDYIEDYERYLVIYQKYTSLLDCFLIEVPTEEDITGITYFNDITISNRKKITLFQAIQKYGTLAMYIGEKFGFEILLKSLIEK
uniref:Uncharacterized protein n=1 Tax=Marseillevirus LCMAC102 TaxID=2506603 RepID=A0A481YT62_9VIRU|nr:MAG: hypothetical protein LCMAC102_00640 [Marseillevirus LCMAC102]